MTQLMDYIGEKNEFCYFTCPIFGIIGFPKKDCEVSGNFQA